VSDARAAALAYLAAHHVMTLATAGPEGIWAAAVFYANEDFTLTFLSAGHTRHAQALAAGPQVAATIQEDYRDWPAIKGIQLSGTARQLLGAEREAAIGRYRAKYPFIAQPIPALVTALARVNWYQLEPDLVYFIDNSKGFGHRDVVVGGKVGRRGK
jgi:uncharacterized protein YhbP (UPF0306 family)